MHLPDLATPSRSDLAAARCPQLSSTGSWLDLRMARPDSPSGTPFPERAWCAVKRKTQARPREGFLVSASEWIKGTGWRGAGIWVTHMHTQVHSDEHMQHGNRIQLLCFKGKSFSKGPFIRVHFNNGDLQPMDFSLFPFFQGFVGRSPPNFECTPICHFHVVTAFVFQTLGGPATFSDNLGNQASCRRFAPR